MEEQLKNFWERTVMNNHDLSTTWNQEVEQLYKYNLNLETALQYLHFEKPTLEEFSIWMANHVPNNNREALNTENILTDVDLQFWNKNGYIVLKSVITEEDCTITRNAIWDFLQMQPDNPESWYKNHQKQSGLMVNFYDHPALNKNRDSAKIRKAYQQLYQTTSLFKTIDKVSFNPPITANYTFKGSGLHWDVSLHLPIPLGLQGLVYLSDCESHDGAFHCIPGFHHRIEEWMHQLPPEVKPREYAVQQLSNELVPVTGKAGDFVIWHQALPHCAAPNHGLSPRMVQYLTYFPENYKGNEVWL